MKLIMGIGETLVGRLLLLDGFDDGMANDALEKKIRAVQAVGMLLR